MAPLTNHRLVGDFWHEQHWERQCENCGEWFRKEDKPTNSEVIDAQGRSVYLCSNACFCQTFKARLCP